MPEQSLALEVSKWLIERRPCMLNADPRAAGEVCGVLAEVLGANLATVMASAGHAAYLEALKRMMVRADDAARGVVSRATTMAAAGEGGGHAYGMG